jgi:hypothetical protein
MSGGTFDYKQYDLGYIADVIKDRIDKNDNQFKPETINAFETAITIMSVAEIYAQRIDWLLAGDDGEDTFHERLSEDLARFIGDKHD